jgi:hypothetical protein
MLSLRIGCNGVDNLDAFRAHAPCGTGNRHPASFADVRSASRYNLKTLRVRRLSAGPAIQAGLLK